MKLYQCSATGPMLHFSGRHTFRSKKVFLSEKAAEGYFPTFIERCITDISSRDLTVLESITETAIIELECDEL